MSLQAKICAVMADVGAISKDRENAHFHYNYVSAEAVRAKVQKACVKHGLVLRLTYDREDVTPGVSVMKASCSVSDDGVTFVHLGDGWGAGTDKGDKSPMKACTAAAKYALANAFCIALGDDPEADEETDREPRMGEKLSAPGYGLGPEETQRAETQGAAARSICDGFINMALASTHVDEIMAILNEHIAVIDGLGHVEIKRFGKAVVAHIEATKPEGITATGFREAFAMVTKAHRRAQKEAAE